MEGIRIGFHDMSGDGEGGEGYIIREVSSVQAAIPRDVPVEVYEAVDLRSAAVADQGFDS